MNLFSVGFSLLFRSFDTSLDKVLVCYRGISRTRRNSGGYCELCRVQYTSLRCHLLSSSHQSFVTNISNYGELDDLIKQVSVGQQNVTNALTDKIIAASSFCLTPSSLPDASSSSYPQALHLPSVVPSTHSQQP